MTSYKNIIGVLVIAFVVSWVVTYTIRLRDIEKFKNQHVEQYIAEDCDPVTFNSGDSVVVDTKNFHYYNKTQEEAGRSNSDCQAYKSAEFEKAYINSLKRDVVWCDTHQATQTLAEWNTCGEYREILNQL